MLLQIHLHFQDAQGHLTPTIGTVILSSKMAVYGKKAVKLLKRALDPAAWRSLSRRSDWRVIRQSSRLKNLNLYFKI